MKKTQLLLQNVGARGGWQVVFDGRDLVDVDESAPYARKPIDYYTETKARAPPAWELKSP